MANRSIKQVVIIQAWQIKPVLASGCEWIAKAVKNQALNRLVRLIVYYCLLIPLAHAGNEQHFAFDIPQQRADVALRVLANQAGLSVVFDFDVISQHQANALSGNYSVKKAVELLLADTGLRYEFDSSGHLIITKNSELDGENVMGLKSKKQLLASVIAMFVGSGGVQGVLAQGEGGAVDEQEEWLLEEIVVTAQKREQRLIDVPMSITAMTGEMLENKGIHNINDLSFAVPSLSVMELGSGWQAIAIRGVNNSIGNASLVGLYVDESPVSIVPSVQLDLRAVDLERVEVLKGPQGTLYGAGAVGGAIRYITKNPSFDDVEGSLGVSVYNTHKGDVSTEYNGALNIPVVDDVLAIRIAASYQDIGGWIDQPDINKENINDKELSHIRIKGLWQVADNLEVNVSATSHRSDGGGYNLINFGDPGSSYYRSAVDRDASPAFRHDYDLYNITVNYNLDFATLTSASTYADFVTKSGSLSLFSTSASFPTGLTERIDYDGLFEGDLFSQEIRLASNGEGPMTWTLGAFYSKTEDSYMRGELKLQRPGVSLISLPAPTEKTEHFFESSAVFADLAYNITDTLTIGVGTRYFEQDAEYDGRFYEHNPKGVFDDVSSRAYVSYALNEDFNMYLNIGQGFRPGGFSNRFEVARGANGGYDSEHVVSYELGSKGSLLDNHVNIELALFLSTYEDYQSRSSTPGLTGFSTENSAEAEIKGVEWNLQWMALDNLSLGFSGNVIDTEFTKIDSLPATFHEGDQINDIPEYSYSLNLDYRFEWSNSTLGFARMDYNKQGESTNTDRGGAYVTEEISSNTVSFLNAQIGAEWETLSLELFGENLLDEEKSPMAWLVGATPQNRRRTLGVKIGYDF